MEWSSALQVEPAGTQYKVKLFPVFEAGPKLAKTSTLSRVVVSLLVEAKSELPLFLGAHKLCGVLPSGFVGLLQGTMRYLVHMYLPFWRSLVLGSLLASLDLLYNNLH